MKPPPSMVFKEFCEKCGISRLKEKTTSEISLADLVAQVTLDNLHDEVDTGPSVGKEIW